MGLHLQGLVAMAEKLYFDLMLSRQLYNCLCKGISNAGVKIGPLVEKHGGDILHQKNYAIILLVIKLNEKEP